jgi:hypothetical protein
LALEFPASPDRWLRFLDRADAHSFALMPLLLAPLPRLPIEDVGLAVMALALTGGGCPGHDKNALCNALLRFGFGFIEVGPVTPGLRPENPRPLIFRLQAGPGDCQPTTLQQGLGAVCALLGGRGGIVGLISKAPESRVGNGALTGQECRSTGKFECAKALIWTSCREPTSVPISQDLVSTAQYAPTY